MASNVYECLFILDSNRYARDPSGVSGQIPQIVEKCGGETLASRLWVEQRLAYRIEGHRKGTYWLTFFRMDSQKVVDFNRACQLNESIIRNLTTKVEPRLVDTLVAHARGEATRPAAEAEEATAAGDGETPVAKDESGENADSATDDANTSDAGTDDANTGDAASEASEPDKN